MAIGGSLLNTFIDGASTGGLRDYHGKLIKGGVNIYLI